LDDKTKELSKMVLLNRQPTLFRHSLNAVNILPCENGDDTIRLPPLMLEQYNADHDGDQLNLYLIHDQEALLELEEKAHLKNVHRYDSDNSMITKVRHEALQACYSLSEKIEPNYDKSILEIDKLEELPEDFDYWNYKLDKPIKINNKIYTYGICLLNKWMGLDDIQINYTITKNESNNISEIIYEEKEDYLKQINSLHKKLLFFISSTNHCPTINIEELISILDDDTDKLFQKLPKTNPYVGYHINEALIDRCINNLSLDSDLFKLYKAGSRFSKQQLSNICINIGYVADAKNMVVNEPICSNLMKGLDPETYFRTAPGSRKGK